MPRKKLEKQPHWLNKKQMAASIGISVQAFDKWGVEPVAKIGREYFYEVGDVINNRAEKAAENNNQPAVKPGTREFEEHRLAKERADNMALKNDQLRAKQVPIELLTMVLSRVASDWASLVEALPIQIRRKHPQLESSVLDDIEVRSIKMLNAVYRLDAVADEVVSDYVASIDTD